MYIDKVYKEMLSNILENGVETVCRAKWEDGSNAKTIKTFGVVNRYDLSKEFPIPTLRPIPLKNCIDEILWIWQKKSNNIEDLRSHIWDAWAGEDKTIGKAYGYQVREKLRKVHTSIRRLKESNVRIVYTNVIQTLQNNFYPILVDKILEDKKNDVSEVIVASDNMLFNVDDECDYYLDQTDYILYELQANPYSRRIIGNLFDICDLDEMNLEPCCYSITLNVTGNKLNMILNQRSADLITAGFWNVFQYAILLNLFAIHCGYEAGELVHVIGDAHIYDKHIDIAKEIISRPIYEGATLKINPKITNFYDFTIDDFEIENYKHNEQIKNIPVAV